MVNEAYGALAPIYDALMQQIPYNTIANIPGLLRSTFGGRVIRTVLDLGCGTGALTERLLARGYDPIGVDLSPDMLSAAYERFAGEENPPLLLQQDITELDLYDTVDCCVSSLDCINYLPSVSAMKRCLERVFLFLNEGGYFVFDLNTPFKFETEFNGTSYAYETDGAFCVWQNDYHPKSRFCDFYLTVFREEDDGRYERTDEVQREYVYGDRTVLSALRACGFDVVGVFSDYELTPKADGDLRHVFVARKPQPCGK